MGIFFLNTVSFLELAIGGVEEGEEGQPNANKLTAQTF